MIAGILFAAAIQTAGPWIITDQTSLLDGRRNVTAAVVATVGLGDQTDPSEMPILMIGCATDSEIRIVSLMWSNPYSGSGDPIIAWRFDQGAVRQGGFRFFLTDRSVTHLTDGPADRFMGELASAERVVVRVMGEDAVFDVTGAAEAVALVREACPRG